MCTVGNARPVIKRTAGTKPVRQTKPGVADVPSFKVPISNGAKRVIPGIVPLVMRLKPNRESAPTSGTARYARKCGKFPRFANTTGAVTPIRCEIRSLKPVRAVATIGVAMNANEFSRAIPTKRGISARI